MRKLCVILSMALLLSSFLVSCSSNKGEDSLKNEYVDINNNVTAYWSDGSDFTPVLRFITGSDLHFRQWYTAQTIPRLSYFIDDMYAYAKTQEYDKIDAFIFNGDLTELGADSEFEMLNQVIQSKVNQEETVVLMPYAGHDCIKYYDDKTGFTTDKKEVVARMESVTGNDSGVHITLNGFHFITVSTTQVGMVNRDDEFVEGYDETWIREQLESAEKEDEYKPIFMFFHHPLEGTLMGTKHDDSPGGEDYYLPVLTGGETYLDYEPVFKSTLEKFPQLVYFSGHYHSSFKNPLSIVQDKFTCIDTGALTYCSMISNNFKKLEGMVPFKANGLSAASGMNVVEVDAEGRIKVMPYNIVDREFYRGIGEESNQQLIRYIEDASNPETWLYKKQDRIDAADNPVFTNTQIEVQNTGNGVKIKFYQAKDKDGVDSYLIEVFKNGSEDHFKKYPISSQYFANIVPEFLYLEYYQNEELSGYGAKYYDGKMYLFDDKLQAGEYVLKITPYDVYGKTGTAISTTFSI